MLALPIIIVETINWIYFIYFICLILSLIADLSSADKLCKQFIPRSGPTECRFWSGSTPFDTERIFLKKSAHEKLPSMQKVEYSKVYVIQPFSKDHKLVFKTNYRLTFNAPIATKVICFSHLLKRFRSLYGKQCGPRSDCSYRSSLFGVHTVCFYT